MIHAYDIHFQRNSLEHRILAALCEDNLSTAQIVKNLGNTRNAAAMRIVIADLQKKNYVRSVGFDQWSITHLGTDAYLTLGGKPIERMRLSTASKTADLFKRPNYYAPELGDNCARPGAYDYRKHPSLVGEQRVWYGVGLRRLESPTHP